MLGICEDPLWVKLVKSSAKIGVKTKPNSRNPGGIGAECDSQEKSFILFNNYCLSLLVAVSLRVVSLSLRGYHGPTQGEVVLSKLHGQHGETERKEIR